MGIHRTVPGDLSLKQARDLVRSSLSHMLPLNSIRNGALYSNAADLILEDDQGREWFISISRDNPEG